MSSNRSRTRTESNDSVTVKSVTRNGVESESEKDLTKPNDLDLINNLTNKLSSTSSEKSDAHKWKMKLNGLRMQDALALVKFFNDKIGTNHRTTRPDKTPTKVTQLALALLRHGYTTTQIRQVTLNRMHRWQGDDKMAKYLRPSTLWRLSKFDEYLGELASVHDKE